MVITIKEHLFPTIVGHCLGLLIVITLYRSVTLNACNILFVSIYILLFVSRFDELVGQVGCLS
jgi:hypothetical protein